MPEDPLEQSTPPSPARQLSTPRGKGSSHAQQQGNFTSTSSSCGKGELIGSLAGYPQISTTGCTANCRLPRLVARPTADCHDSLGVARPLLGDARPLLACPLQEEPGGYLHVHSLALRQPLLQLDVTSSPFLCLSWAAFLQHCSVRKLKEY